MNLPDPTPKPGKAHEHIDPEEYHTLYDFEANNEQ